MAATQTALQTLHLLGTQNESAASPSAEPRQIRQPLHPCPAAPTAASPTGPIAQVPASTVCVTAAHNTVGLVLLT